MTNDLASLQNAERALASALAALRQPADTALLHHAQNLVFHLPSLATVARLRPLTHPGMLDSVRRELAIARHLAASGAPVAPSAAFPAEPVVEDGFAITF